MEKEREGGREGGERDREVTTTTINNIKNTKREGGPLYDERTNERTNVRTHARTRDSFFVQNNQGSPPSSFFIAGAEIVLQQLLKQATIILNYLYLLYD